MKMICDCFEKIVGLRTLCLYNKNFRFYLHVPQGNGNMMAGSKNCARNKIKFRLSYAQNVKKVVFRMAAARLLNFFFFVENICFVRPILVLIRPVVLETYINNFMQVVPKFRSAALPFFFPRFAP
jgi:hypothetical protein